MTVLRQVNGKWTICSRASGRCHGSGSRSNMTENGLSKSITADSRNFKSWYLGKSNICLKTLHVPQHLQGKRMRFVVEFI